MRLDQWLWAVRLYKTRGLSAEAIKGGLVKVNGAAAKPSHEARPGETVTASLGGITRTVRVLASPRSRVAAKLVPEFAEELTPASEYERQRELARAPGIRDAGAGRPTKQDRRALDEMLRTWSSDRRPAASDNTNDADLPEST